MQVSVEKLEGLERKITVELSAEQVDSEVSKRLEKLTQTVKIDGFRKGKVPVKEVERRYGQSVRQEVLGDMMQRSFFEAVNEKDLRPAGMPHISPKPLTKEGKFEFEATFEIYPEIKIPDFSQLNIEKSIAEVAESDIDETLESIRKQQTEWKTVDRACKNGDQVIIDFTGYIDGKLLERGTAKDFALELGANSMIPGFEEGIIGAKAGDKLTISPIFPTDYHAQELAGKKVDFEIVVHQVKEAGLPVVNDEFAKKLKIKEGTVEALRHEIRLNMERELKNTLKNQTKQKVMDAVIEVADVELPKALVDAEIHQMQQHFMKQLGGKGDIQALAEKSNDLFEAQAVRRVKLGLVIGEFIKQKEIKSDAEKVKEHIAGLAAAYEKPQDVIKWYYSDKNNLSEIEALILEDQVVDKILEQATVNEKKVLFKDVMQKSHEHIHDENCNHDHH